MKIISKYKDYYDYLQGVNGIDNKVILDRTKGCVKYPWEYAPYIDKTYKKTIFAICNKLFTVVIDTKGKVFIGEDIKSIAITKEYKGQIYYYIKNQYDRVLTDVNIKPTATDLNQLHNCPIIGFDTLGKIIKFPKLQDYKIASMYPAQDIYNDLYNWITKHNNPEIQDKRTDIQKIESHGFDKITSFRNIK